MGRVTRRTPAQQIRLSGGVPSVSSRPETLAVEEPLEIRVDGHALTVTMRTPGDDFDLALGLLLTEGVVTRATDVQRLMHCLDAAEDGQPTFNVVDATLDPEVPPLPASSAHPLLTTSACGVCGKASIDAIRLRSRYAVRDDPQSLSPELLAGLPDRLRARQKVFERTGGLHAAGLFTADGEALAVREDVGRHNAVDKVIGWAVRQERLPLAGHVLCVSGRASFELTQKALMAGIPTLVAVSAPSSLAVELAQETGMTLVGFARGQRLTVYAGSRRVVIPDRGEGQAGDEHRDRATG